MKKTVKISFRPALRQDVTSIVELLADDPLGVQRERWIEPLPPSYYSAFDAIDSDPNNELVVATMEDRVVGVLQLTFIPSLTYQGKWRALIEVVRVSKTLRSQGIGRQVVCWAVERARERQCHLVQLTTDKSRPEVQRFYEELGFVATHHGLKLKIELDH